MIRELVDRVHHQPLFNGRELVRIAAAALVALALAAWRLPHPPPRRGDFVIATSDRDQLQPLPPVDPDPRGLAWVGGSMLVYQDDSNLPELVRQQLPAAPAISCYFLAGASFYDEYQAFLHALSQRPAALVVTLNPLWLFNSKSIARWPHLRGPTLWKLPPAAGDWLRHLSISAPRDLVMAALWRAGLLDAAAALRGQGGSEPAGALPVIRFWALHELGIQRSAANEHKWMAKVMTSYLDTSPGTFNMIALERMISLAKQARIPTLIYIPPLDPADVEQLALGEPLDRMVGAVQAAVARSASPDIHFYDFTRRHELPEGRFNDLLHGKNSGGFEQVLAPLVARDLLEGRP